MEKVGLIIGQLSWGGAERQLYELATRLTGHGVKPFVYCLSERHAPYRDLLEERNVPVRLFRRLAHFDLSRVGRLRKVLQDDGITVAHSWLLNDNAYTALALHGISIPWIASLRSRPLTRDVVRRRIDRWAFSRAACIVANQEQVVRYLTEQYGCPPSRVELIPNGIDFDRLQSRRTREEVRSSLDTPPDSSVILFAGRLEPVKNVSLLLEAYEVLNSKLPGVHLWIAGEGSQRAVLEDRIQTRRLGTSVHLLGNRTDLPDLYHAAELFVLCSESEGLPNVVLEAMGCGIPVLVSESGGCGNLVEDGVTGWLCPENTPAAYAQRIEAILRDHGLRLKVGERGRKRVLERYPVEKMVERFASLYMSLTVS